MPSVNMGLEFRITQTLVVALVVTALWIFNFITQPQAEIHRVNFGSQAQLISVVPAPEIVARGRNVQFTVRWWLLEPLASGTSISYRLRNRRGDVAVLDTSTTQTTGHSFTEIPLNGFIFNDKISLPIPPNAVPGIYEVVTYLYPLENHPLDPSLGSPIFSPQRTLFTITIVP